MKTSLSEYKALVQSNIRAFRAKRGLSHRAVAKALSDLLGCSGAVSQSQSNEKAGGLPYVRLAALAEVFETEPWQFFVQNPPDLEDACGGFKAARLPVRVTPEVAVGAVPSFSLPPDPEEEGITAEEDPEFAADAESDAMADMAEEMQGHGEGEDE